MARRLLQPTTCLLVSLLALPPAALQDPRTPAIFVAAFRTTADAQLFWPCPQVPVSPRDHPGPLLVPEVLRAANGLVGDAPLRATIEDQIRRRRRYRLAASPAEADYILLIQATFVSRLVAAMAPSSPRQRTGVFISGAPDEVPNSLNSLAALVIGAADAPPAGVTDVLSLLEAARWQAFATGINAEPASPEALVREFHRRFSGGTVPGLTWIVGDGEAGPEYPRASSLCALPQPPVAGDLDPSRLTRPDVAPPGRAAARSGATAGHAPFSTDLMAVLVPAFVENARGAAVTDLRASDFHVFEDDVEQRVEGFVTGSEPVTVAVVVDTSQSMSSQVVSLRVAASTFIEALGPDAAVMVVSFDSRTYLASDLTRDRGETTRALLALRTGGSASRLYDTLVAPVERLRPVAGPKAIMLLTDGLDVDSVAAGPDLARVAVETSHVVVHAVQFDTARDVRSILSGVDPTLVPDGSSDTNARLAEAAAFLRGLSAVTGGRIEVVSTAERTVERFARMGDELERQYVLYYCPLNQARDTSLRRIRVEVDRPGVTIRARAGYRAAGAARIER